MARKKEKARRAAVYARVSTIDKGQTTKNQIRVLREYAKRAGWTAVIFEEKKSGALGEADRPVLREMMTQVRRREFDVVLVWSFDRFARSLKQLLGALEEMKALEVQFVSYHEQIDTTTPMGEAMFAITGALAQLERRLIQERSKAGYERALDEGKLCHRPRRVFDHYQMIQLFGRGEALETIADKVNVSRATLSRRLTEELRKIADLLKLPQKERRSYFGLAHLSDETLQAVADEYGTTPDNLRRALVSGRRRLWE